MNCIHDKMAINTRSHTIVAKAQKITAAEQSWCNLSLLAHHTVFFYISVVMETRLLTSDHGCWGGSYQSFSFETLRNISALVLVVDPEKVNLLTKVVH